MSAEDPAYTVDEACKIMSCSLKTMYRLLRLGKLGAYKLDPDTAHSQWRIPRQALVNHIQKRREQR